MQTHNVVQGSPEWAALRTKYHTASEAPAMMGCSPYMTRAELLHQKVTGSVRELTPREQELFARGHAIEAAARPIVEAKIGEDLFPVTGTEGNLLASFDGLTMAGDVGWECKSWNQDLYVQVMSSDLAPMYYWQLEQQILVGGLRHVIFTTSDGTEDKTATMVYFPVPGRRESLLAGWAQFDKDLADYKPQAAGPVAVAAAIKAIPALVANVEGKIVISSNLALVKKEAMSFIASIKTDLQTDQDFADAEATVKFCQDGEDRWKLVKSQVIAQTASIEELFSAGDEIAASYRAKRLELDRLVKARKTAIRDEIYLGAKVALNEHVAALNVRLGKPYMPPADADFAGAMRGLKTVKSLRDAVAQTLADAKINFNAIADRIQVNLEVLRSEAQDHAFLFMDAPDLVKNDPEYVRTVIKGRIAEHAEKIAKQEAERVERIRKEEEAKVAAAHAAEVKAAQDKAVAEERERAKAQADAEAKVKAIAEEVTKPKVSSDWTAMKAPGDLKRQFPEPDEHPTPMNQRAFLADLLDSGRPFTLVEVSATQYTLRLL